MDHVTHSVQKIREHIARWRGNAAILWSGGKDSAVLLHLAQDRAGLDLPVVAFTEPWFPRKNEFLHIQAARRGFRLYSPDPHAQSIYQQPESNQIALVSQYHVGGGKGLNVPKDVIPYKGSMRGGEWICSLEHLHRPTSVFHWPWSLALIGHKDVDDDPILGNIPLNTDYVENEGAAADFSYPIREWTDDQVWDYIEENKLLVDRNKYANRAPRPDKKGNNDYIPACTRCVDRNAEGSVFCPKLKRKIPVVENVPRTETLVAGHYTPANPEPISV